MWTFLGAMVGFGVAGMCGWVYSIALRNDIDERDQSIAILERMKESLELQVEMWKGKVKQGEARERLLKAEGAEHALSTSDALGRIRSVLDQIERGS
jgi:prepilin signal peptidase PulO-like enzyme (type II secretory pathway)